MAKARRRDELERLEAELEAARPFLPLAREISDDVARLSADGDAPLELVEQAIAAIPQRERLDVARAVFERLPADRQWAVLERVFGDDELRAALADRRELVRRARTERRLDARTVPSGELLTLGLFREADVSAAVGRRPRSDRAARRVVLRRVEGDDAFAVVEDVFNPEGGYFVNAEYERETWQRERLPAHAVVRPGSRSPSGFEPVLYAGGRVDVVIDSEEREGLLHLGYAMVGDADVFAEGGS